MKKNLARILVFIVIFGGLLYYFRDDIQRQFFKPTDSIVEDGITRDEVERKSLGLTPVKEDGVDSTYIQDIKVVTTGLNIPWEIVFIDNKTMLVTERSGRLLKISITGEKKTIQEVEGVVYIGEGGLLGLALHPQFKNNRWIYLYITTRSGNDTTNRVERFTFNDDSLGDRKVIIQEIPGGSIHNGGRIGFGPDGYLYITTGDAGNEVRAQDRNLLNGKILRIADDGSIPGGNPFDNGVYSYGHRNPQGLTWDNKGRLWSTEHGPSGINTGFDELNLIGKGLNYGWPKIIGDKWEPDMEVPIIQSGSTETWAPAGAVYYGGSIFFTGLRGESLYEVNISDIKNPRIKAHFREEFGRLRAITIGPDGFFYITTSNTDGRGKPQLDDDKIIRINPSVFRR